MKKLLPAIIALVLVTATALTACGKKDMADGKESSTASTTKSTTDLSQAADKFEDEMETTLDDMKSDVEEMLPGNDGTTSTTTAK